VTVVTNTPWMPASDVADMQGINMALFGYPGSGKSTLEATAQDSDLGKDVLIIDADGTAARSLADRKDVMIYPARRWEDIQRIDQHLKTGRHPFKTIAWDTLTAMQDMSLKFVMKASPTPEQATQPEYGRSNQALLQLVGDWCSIAREKGTNVIFSVHATEEADQSTGSMLIRMALTPGVRTGVYRMVDTIGYLSVDNKTSRRGLLLKSNNRIIAKHHQPLTGDQLPLEIPDPTMDIMYRHARGLVA
jgi:hypothetical protein